MTGNLPMTIINLFFVPMISMMVFYKKKKMEYKFNEDFVMKYAICCTVVPTISKVFVVLIKLISAMEIGVDSSYYTIIAIVVAYILPLLWEIWKANIHVSYRIIKESEGDMHDE